MILKDLLGTACPRCKIGVFKELSLTYTARVECSHCRAVFNRLVHANG